MYVIEKSKAIVLKLNNPQRVLATVPTAKAWVKNGVDYVVAPHRIKEVGMLRELGIKAPSPILHYYDWVGQFTPYDHQRMTSACLLYTSPSPRDRG